MSEAQTVLAAEVEIDGTDPGGSFGHVIRCDDDPSLVGKVARVPRLYPVGTKRLVTVVCGEAPAASPAPTDGRMLQ